MNTIDLKQILLRREDSWATPYSRELPVKSTYILLYFLRNRRENRSIDQKTIKDSQTDPQVNIGKTSRGPPAKIGDMLIDSKVSQLKHTKVPKRKHHIKKRDLKKWNTLHESLTHHIIKRDMNQWNTLHESLT